MTAVCQVSDSSTRLKESPFWEQGQRDTQDVIGRFNSATAHAHVTLAELPNITIQPRRAEPITSAAILPPALTLSLSTTMVGHHFLKNVHFSSQSSDPLPKTPTASDLLSGSYNPAKLHPMASL